MEKSGEVYKGLSSEFWTLKTENGHVGECRECVGALRISLSAEYPVLQNAVSLKCWLLQAGPALLWRLMMDQSGPAFAGSDL